MRHLEPAWSRSQTEGLVAHIIATDRRHGDLATTSAGVEQRRRAVVDAEWSWLAQVHGARVMAVASAGANAGEEADASWTKCLDAPLAVQVADCAPVALVSSDGFVGIAHAGWRGLLDGVIEATVDAMEGAGASGIVGVLGPCIRPGSYAFGDADLEELEARLGPSVRSVTDTGRSALDVPAAVAAALGRRDVPLVATIGGCTAEEDGTRWSHRARRDAERQAMVVWMEEAGADDR